MTMIRIAIGMYGLSDWFDGDLSSSPRSQTGQAST
jgi:hypothetical protein